MSTVNYKCPCCGAGLSYSGKSGKLECEACGNAYTTEDMESLEQVTDREEAAFQVTAQTYDTGDDAEMDA